MPDTRVLLDVLVDQHPTPVGHIVQLAAGQGTPIRWSFIRSDGRATGLQSTISRRELEGQIQYHFFLELVADRRHTA